LGGELKEFATDDPDAGEDPADDLDADPEDDDLR